MKIDNEWHQAADSLKMNWTVTNTLYMAIYELKLWFIDYNNTVDL